MPAGRPSVRSPADHPEDFQGCFHGALTIVRNPFLSVGKAWTRKFLTTFFPGIPVARVAPSGTKGEMIDFINSRAAVALPCRICALCKAGQSLPPMEHETPMEHEMLPGAPVFDGAAPVAASLFGGAGTAAVLQGGIELPVELGVQPGLDSGSLSVSPLASMLGTPELNMLAEAASSGLPPSQGFVLPESRPEPPAGGILAGLFEEQNLDCHRADADEHLARQQPEGVALGAEAQILLRAVEVLRHLERPLQPRDGAPHDLRANEERVAHLHVLWRVGEGALARNDLAPPPVLREEPVLLLENAWRHVEDGGLVEGREGPAREAGGGCQCQAMVQGVQRGGTGRGR